MPGIWAVIPGSSKNLCLTNHRFFPLFCFLLVPSCLCLAFHVFASIMKSSRSVLIDSSLRERAGLQEEISLLSVAMLNGKAGFNQESSCKGNSTAIFGAVLS